MNNALRKKALTLTAGLALTAGLVAAGPGTAHAGEQMHRLVVVAP
ncbi:hypothetical protein [Streptomyces sp. NPDC006645]